MRGDFVVAEAGDPVLSAAQLVAAQAGDLLLWDSRCVHCNTPGVETGGGRADELLRVAAYVCMTPAAWAAPDVLAARREAFEQHVTTSHWPHEFHGATPAHRKLPPQQWSDASELQRQLVVGAARARE